MNKRKSLPYGYQDIQQDDVDAVSRALTGDFLTTGPLVESFENELTKLTKAKFAVSCSSGTSALHLACMALGIKKGDWVMIPPYNGPAVNEKVQIELGNDSDFQLYNLAQDIGQQNNLADSQPQKLQEMLTAFKAIRGDVYGNTQKLELK